MSELKIKKSNKTYFTINAGCYCGLIMEKRLGVRMSKLLLRQQEEIKELLSANIDETETYNWTLAYPDNKQTIVPYINPNDKDLQKQQRIDLFSKMNLIEKLDSVFIAETSKEVEKAYLEFHDKIEFLRED